MFPLGVSPLFSLIEEPLHYLIAIQSGLKFERKLFSVMSHI